jgi:YfiH family protein
MGAAEWWLTEASDGDLTDAATVARLRDDLGLDAITTMRQVHGTDVAWAMPGLVPEADALLTYTPNLGALVRVADCVPIVLATGERDAVGVVHAGRKGLVAGVVPAAVKVLAERGKGELSAVIGPHICGQCYELDAVTAREVAEAIPAAAAATRWDTPGADLGAGVEAQLRDLGVRIEHVSGCTFEDDRFFSYRRDATARRQGAIVVLR